jgi:hypothetical protein
MKRSTRENLSWLKSRAKRTPVAASFHRPEEPMSETLVSANVKINMAREARKARQ